MKIIGAIGLILIILGISIKDRRKENVLYIFGGFCLEAYSIYIGDLIFITLQAAFILAAVFGLIKISWSKKIQLEK